MRKPSFIEYEYDVEYEPKSCWISRATTQLLKLDQLFFLAWIYSCVEFLHSRSQFINRKFWCNGYDGDTEDEGDTEIAASIMVKDEEAKLPTISGKRNAGIFCPMSTPAIHPNHPSQHRPDAYLSSCVHQVNFAEIFFVEKYWEIYFSICHFEKPQSTTNNTGEFNATLVTVLINHNSKGGGVHNHKLCKLWYEGKKPKLW